MATIKRAIPPYRTNNNDSFQPHEVRYLSDPRWKQAHELACRGRFEECNRVVNALMKDYGK